jgi:hypothetical protein
MKMGDLGNKLLDPDYKPNVSENRKIEVPYFKKLIKCPVKFTDDILEYVESPEFLDMRLRPLQKKFIEELFSRDDKGNYKYEQGVMCCGMRGGKTITSAFITTFMTQYMLQFDQPAQHFGQIPGTRLTAQVIASSEVQSQETAYAAVNTIIDYSPWWRKYIAYLLEREENEGKFSQYQKLKLAVEFPGKNVAILCLHSNSAALAGKTSYCVVLDELSRFDIAEGGIQNKTQKQTANAVYDTVVRSCSSLKEISKVVTISSPMFEDDYTMQLLCRAKDCYVGEMANVIDILRDKIEEKVDTIYGMHATSFELNPKTEDNPVGFTKGVDFEGRRTENPETYKRDYLAVPPATVNPFFELPERIDRVIVEKDKIAVFTDKIIEETVRTASSYENRFYIGKIVRPLKQDHMNRYYICVDQGASRDTFALAMGHVEETVIKSKDQKGEETVDSFRLKIIIDAVEGWIPNREHRITVSFSNVEEVIKTLAANFNVGTVTYDQWSSVEAIQRLFAEGIYTEQLGTNLEMYDVLKQLIYQGQVEIPDHPDLVRELKQLTLIKGRKVDHPSNGSKDYADAICRVVWCCYNDYILDAIHGKHILPLRQQLPTLRSVASAHEMLMASGMSPDGVIWGQGNSGAGVFGETIIVRQNVIPNLKSK